MTDALTFKRQLEEIIDDIAALEKAEVDNEERIYMTSSLRIMRLYLDRLTVLIKIPSSLGLKSVLGNISSMNKGVIETGAQWPEKHPELADKIMQVSNQAFSARRSIDVD